MTLSQAVNSHSRKTTSVASPDSCQCATSLWLLQGNLVKANWAYSAITRASDSIRHPCCWPSFPPYGIFSQWRVQTEVRKKKTPLHLWYDHGWEDWWMLCHKDMLGELGREQIWLRFAWPSMTKKETKKYSHLSELYLSPQKNNILAEVTSHTQGMNSWHSKQPRVSLDHYMSKTYCKPQDLGRWHRLAWCELTHSHGYRGHLR